jgi:hypothetical protein
LFSFECSKDSSLPHFCDAPQVGESMRLKTVFGNYPASNWTLNLFCKMETTPRLRFESKEQHPVMDAALLSMMFLGSETALSCRRMPERTTQWIME